MNGGEFCDAPSWDVAPFPICQRHALAVYAAVGKHIREDRPRRSARVKVGPPESLGQRGIVYYVDFGTHIKIGFTTNLRRRLASFSRPRTDVMAVEEGTLLTEAQRHAQFDNERVEGRELFAKSDRLMEHIASVAAANADLKRRMLSRAA